MFARGQSDERDRLDDTRPIIMASRVTADDAANARAFGAAGAPAGDPAGLAQWSSVLAIVLGGAGILSLLLAKAADA